MKKILLLCSSFLIACNFIVFSQVVLKYKSHGLIPGTENPMMLIEYIEAGNGGQGVIWDFSGIKEKSEFVGLISESNGLESPAAANANVILQEFNNRFTFSACEDKLEQVGYYFGEGTDSYVKFDEPFIKMKYPFSFGDNYAGQYTGAQYQKEKRVSEINGSYIVSADGIGTLVLPNGVTYKNALRVKETKKTSYGKTVAREEITYRWYLQEHRFPVLVFIKSVSASGECHSFLSAYNPNIKQLKSITATDDASVADINLYPNPTSDFVYVKIKLETESELNVNLFDAAGKYITNIAKGKYAAGDNILTLSVGGLSLEYGMYFLKVSIDGNESIKTFVVQ